jgi:hypothetical protein
MKILSYVDLIAIVLQWSSNHDFPSSEQLVTGTLNQVTFSWNFRELYIKPKILCTW